MKLSIQKHLFFAFECKISYDHSEFKALLRNTNRCQLKMYLSVGLSELNIASPNQIEGQQHVRKIIIRYALFKSLP